MICRSKQILCDVDGVIAVHMPYVKEKLKLPQITGDDYSLPELSPEEFRRVWDYMQTEEYVNGCVSDCAVVDALQYAWSKNVDVIFVTARPLSQTDATMSWLNRELGFRPDLFTGINDKGDFCSWYVGFMKENTIFIDDLPQNCVDVSGYVKKAYCYCRSGQGYSLDAPKDMRLCRNEFRRVIKEFVHE